MPIVWFGTVFQWFEIWFCEKLWFWQGFVVSIIAIGLQHNKYVGEQDTYLDSLGIWQNTPEGRCHLEDPAWNGEIILPLIFYKLRVENHFEFKNLRVRLRKAFVCVSRMSGSVSNYKGCLVSNDSARNFGYIFNRPYSRNSSFDLRGVIVLISSHACTNYIHILLAT